MFDSLTYQKRRKALREKMSNGIILILGNNEAPANYPDNTYKFSNPTVRQGLSLSGFH